VRELVPFHHDPTHTDADIDLMTAEAVETTKPAYLVTPGLEGTVFELASSTRSACKSINAQGEKS